MFFYPAQREELVEVELQAESFYSLNHRSTTYRQSLCFYPQLLISGHTMAAQYINYIKTKAHISKSTRDHTPEPVLTSDDEAFLQRVTSHPEEVGRDPQMAPMDGAEHTEDSTRISSPEAEQKGVQRSLSRTLKEKGKEKGEKTGSPKGKKMSPWGWVAQNMDKRKKVRASDTCFFFFALPNN